MMLKIFVTYIIFSAIVSFSLPCNCLLVQQSIKGHMGSPSCCVGCGPSLQGCQWWLSTSEEAIPHLKSSEPEASKQREWTYTPLLHPARNLSRPPRDREQVGQLESPESPHPDASKALYNWFPHLWIINPGCSLRSLTEQCCDSVPSDIRTLLFKPPVPC